MTKEEAILILRHMSCSLPNFNYREERIIDTWYSILKDYEYKEVFNKVNILLEEDRFQYQAPSPQLVVRDLRKISEKVKLNSYKVYCPICDRLFNSYDEQVKHFDRCSSIEYILNQCKRFNAPCSYSKKELFEMLDESFEEYYKKILRYVQEHTTDKSEKQRIEFIFNPPSEEKAKKFLSKGR